MEKVPLVDELLVIDSDSDDDTRAIAEAEGARVCVHSDVLPRYGSYRGKGEALWKSLYETTGDLVAWSDTDITRLAPALPLRHARAAAHRAAHRLRQGLLPAAHRRGRPAQGGRRRARHGARGATAHQPVLPRAVGLHPAARRASTPDAASTSSRSRSSPATRSRSAISSTSPSGSASNGLGPGGPRHPRSTATRSSKASRG